MSFKRTLVLTAVAVLFSASIPAATVVVSNDVAANTTWFATNTYVLRTVVYVRTNVTLTIEAGTVVKGATNNLISRDGIPIPVAALWVVRGGKLNAVGAPARPIIFTFEGDDVTDPNDVPFNTSGQWGGVVLCGEARINSSANGCCAIPAYDVFEGTNTEGVDGAHVFGHARGSFGGDDNDSSGSLRYVSIRYPGQVYGLGRKFNGLTLAAVGSGTEISYVEVLNGADDGFEWWGGQVNTHHLVAAFCEDDDFDTDQGYRGTNQFWFGIKPPWNGSIDSRGLETEGDLNQTVTGEQPKSLWTVHNATLIGRGETVAAFGGGVCWNSRDEAVPNVFNSIFANFAVGVLIENDGVAEFRSGEADMRHTIVDCAVGPGAANLNAQILFTNAVKMNTVQSALLCSVSYTNDMGLNPRPRPGSPALTNVAPQGSGLMMTGYRGAFGPHDTWADGWTCLSQGGFLVTGEPVVPTTVVVSNDVAADTTWFATNTYLLQTVVYVRSNVTLTIEAGTVIKGGRSNLILRAGIPNFASALWVTRGGKLIADGTREAPIIFTFEGDDVNDPNDVPFGTSGQWGGIVLCGKGMINSVRHQAGGMANPKYESFEGTTADDAGGSPGIVPGAHLYAGGDDNDSSGTLRYVSIRYPGIVFAPARELSGLTLAAVGKGTTIEYVEVYGSSDDAFEWWGGCVNTKYLVAAFCEDDDFDTDQGYRGTNQFWFGIKPPWGGSTDSRGFETDGDISAAVTGDVPKSLWTVHNATLIGRGKTVTGFGGGVCWNSRDEAAPNVFNSIFANFAVGVWIDNDGMAEFINGEADMRHTIVDCAVGSSGANLNAQILFTNAIKMNTVEAALLGGISYTNDLGLDPRPQPGSPALDNVLLQGIGLMQVCYRGAFGPYDRWADGWTCLSQGGFLKPGDPLPIPSWPSPPVLKAERMTNGLFRLYLVVEGVTIYPTTYEIEASLDLKTWKTVAAISGCFVAGRMEPIETSMTPPWQFYRARWAP